MTFAFSFATLSVGRSIAAKIAMIAITIKSSIKVNDVLYGFFIIIFPYVLFFFSWKGRFLSWWGTKTLHPVSQR